MKFYCSDQLFDALSNNNFSRATREMIFIGKITGQSTPISNSDIKIAAPVR